MAIYLLTKAIEGATIALTNCGAGSNAARLARRDLRAGGLDTPDDANTKTVEIDFGVSTAVDWIILGNLSISDAGSINWYYDDSGWVEDDDTTNVVVANENLNLIFTESRTSTKFKFDFVPDGTHTVDLGCVFIGKRYTFPISYQYNNNKIARMRNEVMYDGYGYPYGQNINSATKYIWDIVFHMTNTQRSNLQTELENCLYNLRPFFIYDTNISSEWFLVNYDRDQLTAINKAYDYFEVPLHLEQL